MKHQLQQIQAQMKNAKHDLHSCRTRHSRYNGLPYNSFDDEGESLYMTSVESLSLPFQQKKAEHQCKRMIDRYAHIKNALVDMTGQEPPGRHAQNTSEKNLLSIGRQAYHPHN